MKTMYVMMAGMFLLSMSIGKVNASDGIKSMIKGKWEMTVPDAPGIYQKFTITAREKDGMVLIDFQGGEVDAKDQKFTEKDGKLTGTIYVGEYARILIWEEKGEIKGSADTARGVLSVKFKKI